MKIHLVHDWDLPRTLCCIRAAGKPVTLAEFSTHRAWEKFGQADAGCFNCWMASRRFVGQVFRK